MKLWIMLILVSLTMVAEAKIPKECKYLEEEIENISKKLKAGYREPRGQKLRNLRRDTKDKLHKCKKKYD